ncbi:MAG: 50S ribosomal protein L44e [Nitrososphaeria archaeon]|nr:50S ribosomal protein L44e [Nitrososphaeria archaeon]
MIMPKEMRTYCPRCKRHSEHAVKLYKKGKQSAMRSGVVHHEYDKRGYGGQKFPQQKKTAKTTKKMIIKLECKECGYVMHRMGKRVRKLAIGE